MAVDPSVISTVGTIAPPKIHKVALIFANSNYSQSGFADLSTPSWDAAIVSEEMKTKLGFDTRAIKNATKADIIGAIKGVALGGP